MEFSCLQYPVSNNAEHILISKPRANESIFHQLSQHWSSLKMTQTIFTIFYHQGSISGVLAEY